MAIVLPCRFRLRMSQTPSVEEICWRVMVTRKSERSAAGPLQTSSFIKEPAIGKSSSVRPAVEGKTVFTKASRINAPEVLIMSPPIDSRVGPSVSLLWEGRRGQQGGFESAKLPHFALLKVAMTITADIHAILGR